MTREEADQLADELLAQHPRHKNSGLAKAAPFLRRLFEPRPLQHELMSGTKAFVTPASPLWDVVHRDTDASR
jgi:hypothetical protein